MADNPASLGALENLGFQRQGILREQCYMDGRYRDVVLMSLFAKPIIPHLKIHEQE